MDNNKQHVDLILRRIVYILIAIMLTVFTLGEIAEAFGESLSKGMQMEYIHFFLSCKRLVVMTYFLYYIYNIAMS